MIKWIILSASVILLAIAGLALPKTAASAPALDAMPATVKIVHTWRITTTQAVYKATGASLGTVIAPKIILTHNHFGSTLDRQPSGALVVMDKANHAWRGQATDTHLIAINAGTSLIELPNDLPVPAVPLADDADLQRLTVGRWVTVDYWDDHTQHIAQRDFQIIKVQVDVARLADPDRAIQLGDSGGGAYFSGKLVGNIWSIDVDSAGRPAGSFNIALLPAQVLSYVK